MCSVKRCKAISYKKMVVCGGGIIYVNNLVLRIRIAAKAIRHFKRDWNVVFWFAPMTYLRLPDYVKEVKKALKRCSYKLRFFSHEHISQNTNDYLECYNQACSERVFCVVDEGLSIKNMVAGRTRRLFALQDKFKYRILMSDMPICSGLRDIYTQLRFVDNNILAMTETQFINQYMPQYMSKFKVYKHWSVPLSEKTVAKLLKPYVLFSEWKQNMPVNRYEYVVKLDADEKKAYKQDKENFLQNRNGIGYLQVIQRFQYYYTICRQKVKILQTLLDGIRARHERAVIYIKYRSEIKFLRESGLLRGFRYVIMSGTSDKAHAARLFQDGFEIMLCTYKVEIPILTLHDCSNVIYFSQTFDYKDKIYPLTRFWCDEKQCLNIYDFWVDTGLENLIKACLSQKKNLLKNICKKIAYGRIENL